MSAFDEWTKWFKKQAKSKPIETIAEWTDDNTLTVKKLFDEQVKRIAKVAHRFRGRHLPLPHPATYPAEPAPGPSPARC